jgi:hypothetical protein
MSSMWLRMAVCDLINISYYKYGSHNLRSLTTHGSILLYISFIVYKYIMNVVKSLHKPAIGG